MPERRWLAISAVPVHPGLDGYALRVRGIVAELAKRATVVLLAPPDGKGEERFASELPAGIERRSFPAGIVPDPVLPPPDHVAARLVLAAREISREVGPDALLLWSGTEFLASSMSPPLPAIADRIDCHSLTVWRGLRGTRLRRMPGTLSTLLAALRHERRIVRSFPATVVVGEDDARWLRRIGGRDRVHVIPNGVHVDEPGSIGAEAPEPTVTFTGVLCYRPNIDAALRLAEAIWPAVRTAVPGARLVIAGRQPTPEVEALRARPGIEVLADLPDLRPILDRSWVCVAPMWSGAGIKNKVLEAWAIAKPVVLTPIASNGLALEASMRAYVASDPAHFAERIVALLRSRDERRRIGLASRALTLRSHGWSRAAERFETLLETACCAAPVSLREL
ncbi:hypothetical protein MYXO_00788 [Myxococcaceae bacterium]|jgi:glycosyltransferase involved in cell wall biosynthesis|nr:hypothetical protein MYXO_00788 [Myxococcaceae bacterium]